MKPIEEFTLCELISEIRGRLTEGMILTYNTPNPEHDCDWKVHYEGDFTQVLKLAKYVEWTLAEEFRGSQRNETN